jgi:hypothetical protein
MRRLMLAVTTAAALALTMAAPAVAAPEQNPALHTVTITCGNDTWNVISAHAGLGWLVDGPPGTTPDKLVGGHATFFDQPDGTVLFDAWAAPPSGLEGKYQTCTVAGWGPGDAFYEVWDPAYVLLTPH